MCQLGLDAWGASLGSPGILVLSDWIGAGNRRMMNVRQLDVVPNFSRLAQGPGHVGKPRDIWNDIQLSDIHHLPSSCP